MMSSDKRFTTRVTRSVIEIQSPYFYAQPSQARVERKRSGFVSLSTYQVNRLENREYLVGKIKRMERQNKQRDTLNKIQLLPSCLQ